MTFTSCFIAIPLPLTYQKEFETILEVSKQVVPELRTVRRETPHITLYYLDEQSQHSIDELAHSIEPHSKLLRHEKINVGKLGVFDPHFPRVLYLQAQHSEKLTELNTIFREELTTYYAADNNLPFHAHMTIARIPSDQARDQFHHKHAEIEAVCDVKWEFPITELVLYGVDSTRKPEYHERLVTFAL